MGLEDTSGSSGSGGVPDSSQARALRQKQERLKLDVYNDVLRQMRDAGMPEAQSPSFEDELWRHFNRLPARYALDVNVERPGDVLAHKKLLQQAQEAANTPVFAVRLVQVAPDGSQPDSSDSNKSRIGNAQSPSTYFRHSAHPPPAFGSSTNLEDLALEASRQDNSTQFPRPMHEIAFAMHERPKLLSLLTSLLSEIGLNIQEVHAFSTNDGYSLDVFVVDGWPYEETEQLRDLLQKKTHSLEKEAWPSSHPWSPRNGSTQIGDAPLLNHVETPTDGTDQWDTDFQQLKFGDKVASGSHGDLYCGTYCGQEVAIKVLRTECVDDDMHREFAQEVSIMRKVHHRNVVKFIGACTKPRLCIITEFMTGGSVYDFLHKKKGTFELPTLLRVAIDVCNGMNYLHQNNIIHRDLKSANLLMDENMLVKVADFGVARIQSESGVMTAETGTYRWMAPEIIEHKPYDHKADVFSFGIVLWELLTAKIPYQYLTPIQAAVGVVQKNLDVLFKSAMLVTSNSTTYSSNVLRGLRPTIPSNTHPKLAELMERCWEKDPANRPAFSEVLEIIQLITEEVRDEPDECQNEKRPSFGLLSILRSLPLLNRFCCL